MIWKNENVVVTGAGGFIGSHLTESLLKRGARVRALVHYNSRSDWGHLDPLAKSLPKGLTVIAGDIRDGFLVNDLMEGASVVFHLAALIAIPYSYTSPHSFVETNVMGTLNVLEACRRAKIKVLVHTSTSEVYGTAIRVPMDERHPLQGQSPYAATKIAADHLAESYYRSHGVPVVTLRPFNTFGPRQSARAVIPTILSGLLAGHREIRLGDLRPVRDFTFVYDTVRAFIAAAERGEPGEVYNVGQGRGWSVRDVVNLCRRVTGHLGTKVVADSLRKRPAQSEVWRLVCDSRKARRVFGWTPTFSLEEGLRVVAAYIQLNRDRYKDRLYNI